MSPTSPADERRQPSAADGRGDPIVAQGPPPEVGQVYWVRRALVAELGWAHVEPKDRPFLVVAVAPAGRGGNTYLVEGRTRDPRAPRMHHLDERCLIEVAPSEAGTPRRTFFLLTGGRLRALGIRRLCAERALSRMRLAGALPVERAPELQRLVDHGPYPILRRIWGVDAPAGQKAS